MDTAVPVSLVLHPANVHPLGAVPPNCSYVFNALAVPYVWLDVVANFVLPAVVLLFP